MRLYKVTLDRNDYDLYDSAIIACRSKAVLEDIIKYGILDFNLDCEASKQFPYKIQYDQNFYINSQPVLSIEGIGFTDMETDADAVVVLSSFNAG